MAGLTRKMLNTAYVVPACFLEKKIPYTSPVLVRALQRGRMKAIIRHAWKNVPFYRRAMEDRGLRPADFRSVEDLDKLPLISKAEMREDPSIFHSIRVDCQQDFLIRAGSYKRIFWSRKAALQWFARISRSRQVLNNLMDQDSGYVEFSVNSEAGCNPNLNRYWRELLLFRGRAAARRRVDINESYTTVVNEINRLKPDIVYCFGSYSENLIKFVINRDIKLHSPRIWVYGSDMMGAGTRELIEKRLGCMVYSTYNMNEMGAMSFECERRDGYHINADACFLRIVDEEGNTLPDGETGEVVISNLVNTSTVLLNYRTGDKGRIDPYPCKCGRSLPLLRDLMGRISDRVYFRNGITVSFGQLDAQVGLLLNNRVSLYQIVQDRPGHVRWNLVPLSSCEKGEVERDMTGLMSKALPQESEVEFRWSDRVELTPTMKRKFVLHRFDTSGLE